MFPCNECAKAIIQSGIKRVVYLENKYPDSDSTKATIRMFNDSGISYTAYKKDIVSFVIGNISATKLSDDTLIDPGFYNRLPYNFNISTSFLDRLMQKD